jgi:hypothetical protein
MLEMKPLCSFKTSGTTTAAMRHHIPEGLGPLLPKKCQKLLTNITAFRRADEFQLVMLCPLPLFECKSTEFIFIWTQ